MSANIKIGNENVNDINSVSFQNSDGTGTSSFLLENEFLKNDDVKNIIVNHGIPNYLINGMQYAEIEWSPVKDFCGQTAAKASKSEDTNNGEYVFKAGHVYHGLPYSSLKGNDQFIGVNVLPETFMTALTNPNSKLYTTQFFENTDYNKNKNATYDNTIINYTINDQAKEWPSISYNNTDTDANSTHENCNSYYGTVCSTMLTQAYDTETYETTYSMSRSYPFNEKFEVIYDSADYYDVSTVDGSFTVAFKKTSDDLKGLTKDQYLYNILSKVNAGDVSYLYQNIDTSESKKDILGGHIQIINEINIRKNIVQGRVLESGYPTVSYTNLPSSQIIKSLLEPNKNYKRKKILRFKNKNVRYIDNSAFIACGSDSKKQYQYNKEIMLDKGNKSHYRVSMCNSIPAKNNISSPDFDKYIGITKLQNSEYNAIQYTIHGANFNVNPGKEQNYQTTFWAPLRDFDSKDSSNNQIFIPIDATQGVLSVIPFVKKGLHTTPFAKDGNSNEINYSNDGITLSNIGAEYSSDCRYIDFTIPDDLKGQTVSFKILYKGFARVKKVTNADTTTTSYPYKMRIDGRKIYAVTFGKKDETNYTNLPTDSVSLNSNFKDEKFEGVSVPEDAATCRIFINLNESSDDNGLSNNLSVNTVMCYISGTDMDVYDEKSELNACLYDAGAFEKLTVKGIKDSSGKIVKHILSGRVIGWGYDLDPKYISISSKNGTIKRTQLISKDQIDYFEDTNKYAIPFEIELLEKGDKADGTDINWNSETAATILKAHYNHRFGMCVSVPVNIGNLEVVEVESNDVSTQSSEGTSRIMAKVSSRSDTISFTLDDVQYTVANGTTWSNWLEENTDLEIFIDVDNQEYLRRKDASFIINEYNHFVSASDEIYDCNYTSSKVI